MSVYAGKHPNTEALIWAWSQVTGSEQERREKAERLAEWVLTWTPKKTQELALSTLMTLSIESPVGPGSLFDRHASCVGNTYGSIPPSSLQDFLGALSSAQQIATPDGRSHQAGAAAADASPGVSAAMPRDLALHLPQHDATLPTGYR